MKQKTPNRATREQLAILRQLNKAGVRYLAFGDYAMNALDPARAIGNVQLWVEPNRENFERLNAAIKEIYGPRVVTRADPSQADNPQPRKLITLGDGPQRVGLYPAINGFAADQFETLFTRAQSNRAALLTNRGKMDGSVAYKQLAVPDLYQNVQQSKAYHKAWNIQTLEKYADDHRITLSPSAPSPIITPPNPARQPAGATTPQPSTAPPAPDAAPAAAKPQQSRMVRDFEAIKRELDVII